MVNALRYDPWGDLAASESGGGTAVGAAYWKYQGRLDVAPAGSDAGALYDLSARFYAPSLGVFTQLDSVMGSAQDPRSMNRFLYAHANPATLIDPTGHVAMQACSAMADYCPGAGGSLYSPKVNKKARDNRDRVTQRQKTRQLCGRYGECGPRRTGITAARAVGATITSKRWTPPSLSAWAGMDFDARQTWWDTHQGDAADFDWMTDEQLIVTYAIRNEFEATGLPSSFLTELGVDAQAIQQAQFALGGASAELGHATNAFIMGGAVPTGGGTESHLMVAAAGFVFGGRPGRVTAPGGGVSVASGSSLPSASMKVVRGISRGESVMELINELKGLTWSTNLEHAIVRLPGGSRAVVSGGQGGIDLPAGTRVLYHTHPYHATVRQAATGPGVPSPQDVRALTPGIQRSSYLIDHGMLLRYWRSGRWEVVGP